MVDAGAQIAPFPGQGSPQTEEEARVDDPVAREQVPDLARGRPGRDDDRDLAMAGTVQRLEQLDGEPDQSGRDDERDQRSDPPPP